MSGFGRLFTLVLGHEYYVGPWQDLAFVCPAATQHRLRGGRLVPRESPGRLEVFFEQRPDGPAPLVDLSGKKLRWGLVVRVPHFAQISVMPPGPLALYRNSPNPQVLSGPLVQPPANDPEERHLGPFAWIELLLDAGFYATPPTFTLSFQARQQVLRYFVITRKYSEQELAQLTVEDAGFAEDARPQIQFEKVPSENIQPKDLPPNLVAPGDRVLLFRSTQAVVRRERARRKIHLRKNGEILIEHLPQPSADRANSDLIVHLVKP